MALSIKNLDAELLAKELARERGKTITRVVIEALQEALLRTRGRRTAPSVEGAIRQISDRCADLPDLDDRSPDEILGYDDHGGFA